MTPQAYPEKFSSKTFTKGKESSIFLKHILENIENIEIFSKGLSKQEMLKDNQKQYAIIRAIEIIGEAVKNLSISFRNKYSEVPWREIIGTRDKLIHHYFGVDLEMIWKIIKEDLPKLKKDIEEILNKKIPEKNELQ